MEFMLKAKTKNISIVLYKPKYAGNIGSVARAAKNMGISNIIVVGADGFDREAMQQRSTHLAADVLDKIQYVQSVEDALGGFNYIVGTTARLGKGRGPFITPRAAAPATTSLATAWAISGWSAGFSSLTPTSRTAKPRLSSNGLSASFRRNPPWSLPMATVRSAGCSVVS